MHTYEPRGPTSVSENNAVILTRLEEQMVAIREDLSRIEKSLIPHGEMRMRSQENTSNRQWVAIVTLFVAFAALTGQTLIPVMP